MLWGNSAVIAGLLLGVTFSQQGAKIKPGSVLTLNEMPFYYYTDADGDQIALPCTERMLSSKMAELVSKHRFMPMLSMKGAPEIRLGGFGSLSGGPLAGPWQPAGVSKVEAVAEPEEAPEPEEEEQTTEEAASETTEAATESAEPATESDPELDKLLASLSEDTTAAVPAEEAASTENAEPEMDPELAKLLKELG